ncbi:MAG: rhodanese-like domain-containing protein [Acidimicrobiales bacterium]
MTSAVTSTCSTSASPTSGPGGHIPGATFITGAELPERLDEAPDPGPGRALAVVCGSGYRSSASARLIVREGAQASPLNLVNVIGGMSDWDAADQ